jgi:hypothetical protein
MGKREEGGFVPKILTSIRDPDVPFDGSLRCRYHPGSRTSSNPPPPLRSPVSLPPNTTTNLPLLRMVRLIRTRLRPASEEGERVLLDRLRVLEKATPVWEQEAWTDRWMGVALERKGQEEESGSGLLGR